MLVCTGFPLFSVKNNSHSNKNPTILCMFDLSQFRRQCLKWFSFLENWCSKTSNLFGTSNTFIDQYLMGFFNEFWNRIFYCLILSKDWTRGFSKCSSLSYLVLIIFGHISVGRKASSFSTFLMGGGEISDYTWLLKIFSIYPFIWYFLVIFKEELQITRLEDCSNRYFP